MGSGLTDSFPIRVRACVRVCDAWGGLEWYGLRFTSCIGIRTYVHREEEEIVLVARGSVLGVGG